MHSEQTDRADIDEFPWHATIYAKGCYSDCSGVLINNKYVLTSARCLNDLTDEENSSLYVRFLIPNLSDTTKDTIQREVTF